MSNLSLAARQARLLALRDLIDVGGAELWFYTGAAVPATPETATLETFLGAVTLAAPSGAIGAAGNVATWTLTVPRVNAATTTGVVGWVRFVDGGGNGVLDLLAGAAAAAAAGTYSPPRQVLLSDLQVYAGGEIQLLSCVISE